METENTLGAVELDQSSYSLDGLLARLRKELEPMGTVRLTAPQLRLALEKAWAVYNAETRSEAQDGVVKIKEYCLVPFAGGRVYLLHADGDGMELNEGQLDDLRVTLSKIRQFGF